MPLHPSWPDIALRLVLTCMAGAVFGVNRGERGHAAGLRTNILVCLAASVSMIQCNLLLATVGKTGESFAVLDLMRLPLGVLTGMGFIGGGAILKTEDRVIGLTTAATLWFVTAVGLCIGGGQTELGMLLVVIGVAVLRGLKSIEKKWKCRHFAALCVSVKTTEGVVERVARALTQDGYRSRLVNAFFDAGTSCRRLTYEIEWYGTPHETRPSFVASLENSSDVLTLEWKTEMRIRLQ